MKFKYGNIVNIEDEFYGKIKGFVRDYQEGEDGIEYLIVFKINKITLSEWFNEKELK